MNEEHPPQLEAKFLGYVAPVLFLVIVISRANLALTSAVDDAFITYRYSWNLAHFGEFTYNLGDRVLATTSPLGALLYTPLAIVFARDVFPQAVSILNLIFSLASSILAYRFLAQTYHRATAILLAIPFVGLTHVYIFAGLETNIFVFTVLVASLAFAREKYVLAGAIAAIGFWVRGESILLLPLFGVFSFIYRKRLSNRILWRTSVGAIAVLIPTLLLASVYFGSPLPSTLGTKIFQGRQEMFGSTFRHLVLSGSLTGLTSVPAVNFSLMMIIVLYLSTSVWRLIRADEKSSFQATIPILFVAFGFVQALFYSLLGVGNNYPWYQVPLVLAVVVGSLAGTVQFLSPLGYSPIRGGITVGLLVMILFLNRSGLPPWSGSLGVTYKETAAYLNDVTGTDDVIALGEAGMIGYYLDGRTVFDYLGVITPYFSLSSSDSWTEQLQAEFIRVEPDYIVASPPAYAFIDEEDYTLLESLDPDYFHWMIEIYGRNGSDS